jgi:lipopolysaccharide transport system ATP-binding protein
VDFAQLDKGNLVVTIGFKSPFALNPPVAGLVISSTLGTPVFGSNPRFHKEGFTPSKMSTGFLQMTVNNLPIHGGIYQMSIWLGDWQTDYDEKRDVLSFEFKHGHRSVNAPNPEFMGFMDVPGIWSLLGETATVMHENKETSLETT